VATDFDPVEREAGCFLFFVVVVVDCTSEPYDAGNSITGREHTEQNVRAKDRQQKG
jgi:hypothetical protein